MRAALRSPSLPLLLAALAAATLPGCAGGDGTVAPGEVAGVVVTPAALALAAGHRATLTATVRSRDGTALTGRTVAWRSEDTLVARVSAAGAVTGVGPGATRIVAVADGVEGVEGVADVTVTHEPVASVRLPPGPLTLAVGDTAALRATVLGDVGDTLGVMPGWSSSDTAVATVSAAGTVLARAIGAATLTASAEGVAASVPLSVVRPAATAVRVSPGDTSLLVGQSLALRATVADRHGAAIAEARVTWISSDTTVARVSGAGKVAALAPGTATITARSDSARDSARVAVAWGAVALHGVPYCAPGGVPQTMDVYTPATAFARPVPLVVHVHGGSWQSGAKAQAVVFTELRDSLLARGIAVATIDYRLAPAYRWPAQIEDAKCALRGFRANAARWGIDPARIGAWGESAGGQLAALLALTDASAGLEGGGGYPNESSRAQVAATINAVADLTRPGELNLTGLDRVFPTWPDSASAELAGASPVAQASPGDSPMLLLQSADDTLVSPAQAARLADRLHAAGVEAVLQPIAHAGHGLDSTGQPIDPGVHGIVRLMAAFLARHLR